MYSTTAPQPPVVEKTRSCKTLSIIQKYKLIKEVEGGFRKKKDIAAEFGIPPNTLSTILKNKELVLRAVRESSFWPSRKRLKKSNFPDVEEGMVQWFKNTQDRNLPVSGPLLKQTAERLADQLGHHNFKASTGWLDSFKHRNGISHKIRRRRSAAVPDGDCEQWKKEILPELIRDYEPNDIFNADEAALFFKCLPEKTLKFRKETCHNGERSQHRVTIIVAANMSGTEKLKLLVIGKAKKSALFKGMKSLPVMYEHNSKSWMTQSIFESWLKRIDRKFQHDKRKVLLFVDNCPAHPVVQAHELKAIQLVFLPPSKQQPMDKGIIKTLKYHYRRRLVCWFLEDDAQEKVMDMNLLDCIRELDKSWDDVKPKTISKCFRESGIFKNEFDESDSDEDEEELPLSKWIEFQKCVGCEDSFQEYVEVDSNALVADYPSDSDIVRAVKSMECKDSEDEEILGWPASVNDAIIAMSTVRSFVQSQLDVNDEIFKAIILIEQFCEAHKRNTELQLKMSQFLSN